MNEVQCEAECEVCDDLERSERGERRLRDVMTRDEESVMKSDE